MNAIELLRDQHMEVMDLFEFLEQATDDDEKQALFDALADELAAHASIEERLFYPVAYRADAPATLARAIEDHSAMKRVLAELFEMAPDHEEFADKLQLLREQVERHVFSEDRELFSRARRELSDQQLDELGQRMKREFEAELDSEPTEAVWRQATSAAPPL